MKITTAKPRHTDEMYNLFRQMSVTSSDLQRNPVSGFYEYHLTDRDIMARIASSDYSLVMQDRRKIKAYMLAYPLSEIPEVLASSSHHEDPVLDKIRRADPFLVYVDQMCISAGCSGVLAARMIDAFEDSMRNEKFNGLVAAIPCKPWINRATLGLALHRGFGREQVIHGEGVDLAIFAKPFLVTGEEFNPGERVTLADRVID